MTFCIHYRNLCIHYPAKGQRNSGTWARRPRTSALRKRSMTSARPRTARDTNTGLHCCAGLYATIRPLYPRLSCLDLLASTKALPLPPSSEPTTERTCLTLQAFLRRLVIHNSHLHVKVRCFLASSPFKSIATYN